MIIDVTLHTNAEEALGVINRRLRLNEFHELLPGLGLIEDPGEIRSDGHGVLFLYAAHLHA